VVRAHPTVPRPTALKSARQARSRCDPLSALLANPPVFTHTSRNYWLGGIFMTIVGSRNFQFGLMLATALSVSLLPTTGQAYTPEQQQACTPDAMRLCGPEIPDVDRVTACMIRNKSQLSPECRAFFRAGPEPSEAAVAPSGRPMAISPATPRKASSAKSTRAKSSSAKSTSAKPSKPKKPAAT
jgi:hypothetical protein